MEVLLMAILPFKGEKAMKKTVLAAVVLVLFSFVLGMFFEKSQSQPPIQSQPGYWVENLNNNNHAIVIEKDQYRTLTGEIRMFAVVFNDTGKAIWFNDHVKKVSTMIVSGSEISHPVENGEWSLSVSPLYIQP